MSVVVGAAALLVTACGTAEESQSTSTSATTGVSSSTTSTSSASTSTTAASTTSTSLPATTSVPIGDELVLRSDGVGPFDFGTDMDIVVPWVTARLGPGTLVDVGPFAGMTPVFDCAEQRVLRWPAAGLTLGMSDSGAPEIEPTGCSGVVGLTAWRLSADGSGTTVALRTNQGLMPGSTVDELMTAVPSAVLLAWNDSTFYPPGFYVPSEPGMQPMIGLLDWDWISDLQRALNDRGADLVVDGESGPRTKAALEEFRDRAGLADAVAVVRALGLAPGGGARVVSLDAGNWFWEFECGTMEPLESC